MCQSAEGDLYSRMLLLSGENQIPLKSYNQLLCKVAQIESFQKKEPRTDALHTQQTQKAFFISFTIVFFLSHEIFHLTH